jgi:hypothetical protein
MARGECVTHLARAQSEAIQAKRSAAAVCAVIFVPLLAARRENGACICYWHEGRIEFARWSR